MQKNSFENFGLSHYMIGVLKNMQFKTPTEVQSSAIAPALSGQDLLVQAPTGTGKTAAFGIPLIENITNTKYIQAMVVCPTRELVLQTSRVLEQLAEAQKGIKVVSIYGGESIARQFSALRRNPQIVVATPGRLIDHLKRKSIKLNQVKVAVLDEADRMLDMGFRDDLKLIFSNLPSDRQTLLFSATMSKDIMRIAEEYQNRPKNILIKKTDSISQGQIPQFYAETPEKRKQALLMNLLEQQDSRLSLVFVNTKAKADTLAKQLKSFNIKSAAIHGDVRQFERDKIMRLYRSNKISVLVATDVAARGIDVPEIDTVFNYDLPHEIESYVHRVGRTGRAMQKGVAYSFVCPSERHMMRLISQKTKMKIEHMSSEIEITPNVNGAESLVSEVAVNEDRPARANTNKSAKFDRSIRENKTAKNGRMHRDNRNAKNGRVFPDGKAARSRSAQTTIA